MIELQTPPWWQEVPVLSGPAIEVRETVLEDAPALLEMLNDPEVARFISTPPPTLSAFRGFIRWTQQQRLAGSCLCLSVVPTGLTHPIGVFQLRAIEPAFRTAEWGFALSSSFWSTGIFVEAASLVVEFAFTTLGVHRLEARAVVENARGNRALEKMGATGEAVLRRSFNGTHSQFLWSIVAAEWKRPDAVASLPFDAARLQRHIAAVVDRSRTPGDDPLFPFFLTESRDGSGDGR